MSDYKSKVGWPEQPDNLPTYQGNRPGRNSVRKAEMEAQGMKGIRRVDWQDGQGNSYTMNTRNGFPEIVSSRSTQATSGQISAIRGFVAHVPAGSVATRFSPYTLAISDPAYRIFKNTYTVLPFATTYNVPTGDVTHWLDVASFYNSKVLINGKEMPLLLTTGIPSGDYIPWVIPHTGTGLDVYGDVASNGYEKRVFAVGRHDVRSWGGSGVTSTLLPSEARTNNKALTIGQRIVTGDHSAYLGQLFSYPYTQVWDSLFCEWYWSSAKVSMLLTGSYLAKIDSGASCVLPDAGLGLGAASSGTMSTPTTLPDLQVFLTGVGEVALSSLDYRLIEWPWTGTESHALAGRIAANYNRTAFSGAASSVHDIAGVTLTYSGSNYKNFDVRVEDTRVAVQVVEARQMVESQLADLLTADETTLSWVGPDVLPYRGRTTFQVSIERVISGSSITRNYEDQVAAFSVTSPYGALVSLSFSKHYSYGQMTEFTPNNTYYSSFLADPYGLAGVSFGMGVCSQVLLTPYVNPANDLMPIHSEYKIDPPPVQTPETLAEISAEFDLRAGDYAGQFLYDNENSDGFFYRPIDNQYYYCAVGTGVLNTVSLIWSTRDYILHDAKNGVFISVHGSFSGTGTTASLTVNLVIQTRFSSTTKLLGVFNFTYSELLPEKPIGFSGKSGIPSPKIRAMFAPLYQEQGSFKGAHYVTLAEESNGAASAHLFNFVLYLQSYGGLSSCNEDNRTQEGVYFVPCNLLEMLYAYVFSSKYGVDDYQRYPVDNVNRYNQLMTYLFNVGIHITVRDGAVIDWTDSFGGAYATIATEELTRT